MSDLVLGFFLVCFSAVFAKLALENGSALFVIVSLYCSFLAGECSSRTSLGGE